MTKRLNNLAGCPLARRRPLCNPHRIGLGDFDLPLRQERADVFARVVAVVWCGGWWVDAPFCGNGLGYGALFCPGGDLPGVGCWGCSGGFWCVHSGDIRDRQTVVVVGRDGRCLVVMGGWRSGYRQRLIAGMNGDFSQSGFITLMLHRKKNREV